MSAIAIVELTAEQTHPLRLAVLRFDTVTKDVVFLEDTWPGARHLGARVGGGLVAVSTWVPRPHHGQPAVQLRGMATSRAAQGLGHGGTLLEGGCERMARKCASVRCCAVGPGLDCANAGTLRQAASAMPK